MHSLIEIGTYFPNFIERGSYDEQILKTALQKASNVIATPVAASITCGTGLVSCCQAGPYQCGVQYPPVAGSPVPAAGQAPYGAYPWQAVLLGPGGVYVGSGVLLNAQNVLTVAHKVTQFVYVL